LEKVEAGIANTPTFNIPCSIFDVQKKNPYLLGLLKVRYAWLSQDGAKFQNYYQKYHGKRI
tara:strand:+ start:47310 stop:47492 length:183 start_codon:yes stop_codon:yes gene_type:complete